MTEHATADLSGPGRRVLVPVANPASLPPLLGCARHLADVDGEITLLTVLTPALDDDERWRRRADLAAAAATTSGTGADADQRVHARCIEARSVSRGVLRAAEELEATLVLMGWRGASSTSDVFGRLIDEIVGRSTSPLAILRPGVTSMTRVVLPVSPDHLLPGGERGLRFAAGLAWRLRRYTSEEATVLRTGAFTSPLPAEVSRLGDRVHHDYRRVHHAVGAFTRAGDVVVAAVAPTVSGLRAATTHLAWSTPEAGLLVAIDGGRIRGRGVVDAVAEAGRPLAAGTQPPGVPRERRVAVTIRLPDATDVPRVERILAGIGHTDHVMTWWPPNDGRTHLGATVHVSAATTNGAIATIAAELQHASALRGAEISYDVEGGSADDAVTTLYTEPVSAEHPGGPG